MFSVLWRMGQDAWNKVRLALRCPPAFGRVSVALPFPAPPSPSALLPRRRPRRRRSRGSSRRTCPKTLRIRTCLTMAYYFVICKTCFAQTTVCEWKSQANVATAVFRGATARDRLGWPRADPSSSLHPRCQVAGARPDSVRAEGARPCPCPGTASRSTAPSSSCTLCTPPPARAETTGGLPFLEPRWSLGSCCRPSRGHEKTHPDEGDVGLARDPRLWRDEREIQRLGVVAEGPHGKPDVRRDHAQQHLLCWRRWVPAGVDPRVG